MLFRSGVQFSLRGPELAQLGKYADDLYGRIRKNPRAVDVDTSLVYGKPELRVEINRQRAADLGVRVQDIANSLNVLVGGQNVTTFDVGEDQYDVTLRAVEGFRTTAEGVQRMTVPSSKRGTVDISEQDINPLSRQRGDQRLTLLLSARNYDAFFSAAQLRQRHADDALIQFGNNGAALLIDETLMQLEIGRAHV